ncbi:uncharacterized protein BX663DRAFT_505959 [Cokeromyces recurvatus]|uniref:uncharacterized protein n=1 Tax=Cokeromyces recurvatus TaxID=90255 RepID=UPI00221EFE04|nr:uncharacterized protein BX663DRAFT_505959 [Cokeromyces recurvatus]KAI7903977.1 hypothetical protein BX663DRAFT_505959 [Cokeromyces recurvatus]
MNSICKVRWSHLAMKSLNKYLFSYLILLYSSTVEFCIFYLHFSYLSYTVTYKNVIIFSLIFVYFTCYFFFFFSFNSRN